MLKIRIIVVDRTRASFLREGESFYLKRLKRYARTEWVEIRPAKIRKGTAPACLLAAEGHSLTKKISPADYLIALDRSGKALDSKGLARLISRLSLSHPCLTFMIGGPLGLSPDLLDKARHVLSLSTLTLTHEMARLVLLEQLYRAFTIINKAPYHK